MNIKYNRLKKSYLPAVYTNNDIFLSHTYFSCCALICGDFIKKKKHNTQSFVRISTYKKIKLQSLKLLQFLLKRYKLYVLKNTLKLTVLNNNVTFLPRVLSYRKIQIIYYIMFCFTILLFPWNNHLNRTFLIWFQANLNNLTKIHLSRQMSLLIFFSIFQVTWFNFETQYARGCGILTFKFY